MTVSVDVVLERRELAGVIPNWYFGDVTFAGYSEGIVTACVSYDLIPASSALAQLAELHAAHAVCRFIFKAARARGGVEA